MHTFALIRELAIQSTRVMGLARRSAPGVAFDGSAACDVNPGVANKERSAPFAISVQSAGRAALSGILNSRTACLFTAVVGELSSPVVVVDVRHLLAADESGLAVVASEDAHRRTLRGRLMLVGSPIWLQTALRTAGYSHLLPWIRLPSTSMPRDDLVAN